MSGTSVVQVVKQMPKNRELMERFLRWQCRVRQISVREHDGRPDDAITPALTLAGESEPLGHIITLICKHDEYSKTPEMQHMVKRTHDPAQRRDKALEYFQTTYYQRIQEFNDALTATFPPHSPGAAKIAEIGQCTLSFNAYGQNFELLCSASRLETSHSLYQATYWHNMLFNPALHPDTEILQFIVDWDKSTATPG